MTGPNHEQKGSPMANENIAETNTPVDFKKHARDYSLLIAMLKWGAVAAFLIAMLVLFIIAD